MCCLIYKMISFLYYSKKLVWIQKLWTIVLNNIMSKKFEEDMMVLKDVKDQVHSFTSLFSGLFKVECTDTQEHVKVVKKVFGSLEEFVKLEN